MEFDVFSDGSGHGSDRYRAIGLVLIRSEKVEPFRSLLRKVLGALGGGHVEWKEIGGDSKDQACAVAFIKMTVKAARDGDLFLTVLSWDLDDSRHGIRRRDDLRNYERMYYHAVVTSARRRGAVELRLYPDATSETIDYRELRFHLENTKLVRPKPHLLSLFDAHGGRFRIADVREQESKDEPLVQVADLFCGMGRASLEYRDELRTWLRSQSASFGQGSLFNDGLRWEEGKARVSRGKNAKFRLIKLLKEESARYKMGVSIESRGYLWTPRPPNPINFWLYEPQHELDKAPVKAKRF